MLDERLYEEQPAWERDLDALVRPALVLDPPPDVQQSILAAALQATAHAPALHPSLAPPIPNSAPIPTWAQPIPASEPASDRPLPITAYLLLAAVLVAYIAAVSWLNGLFGGGAGWLSTLLTQLLAVSDLVVGRPETREPLALVWQLFQRAPWLALLPLGWLLWERDRAATRAADHPAVHSA